MKLGSRNIVHGLDACDVRRVHALVPRPVLGKFGLELGDLIGELARPPTRHVELDLQLRNLCHRLCVAFPDGCSLLQPHALSAGLCLRSPEPFNLLFKLLSTCLLLGTLVQRALQQVLQLPPHAPDKGRDIVDLWCFGGEQLLHDRDHLIYRRIGILLHLLKGIVGFKKYCLFFGGTLGVPVDLGLKGCRALTQDLELCHAVVRSSLPRTEGLHLVMQTGSLGLAGRQLLLLLAQLRGAPLKLSPQFSNLRFSSKSPLPPPCLRLHRAHARVGSAAGRGLVWHGKASRVGRGCCQHGARRASGERSRRPGGGVAT
eukprot:Sspe_Gene.108620::Locus_87740_Transcript_1_1_Confidence_1.000_Length_1903::g.108620::m.108620